MAARRRYTKRTTTRRRRRRKANNPSGGMGEIVKYGALAFGAWYVYTNWATWFPATPVTSAIAPSGSTTPGTVVSGAGGTTTTPPATTNPPVVHAPATLVVSKSPGGVNLPVPFQTSAGATIADANFASGYSPTGTQMLVYAGGGASLDPDQWLFYYNQLSGDSVTYEQLTLPSGFARSTTVPIQGFINMMPSGSGLSGFGFPSQYTRLVNQWRTQWN